MWILLSIYGSLSIDLKFFAHIFPKMACFCLLFWPPKLFTPTGQFFLQGYIPHIRDIFQLWVLLHLQLHCVMWYETVYEEL